MDSTQKAKTILELIDIIDEERRTLSGSMDHIYNIFETWQERLKSLLLDKKEELEEEQRATQLQIDDPDTSFADEGDLKSDRAIIHHQIQLIDIIWGTELK